MFEDFRPDLGGISFVGVRIRSGLARCSWRETASRSRISSPLRRHA